MGLAKGFCLKHICQEKKIAEDLATFPRCMAIGKLFLGEENRKLRGPGYPQAAATDQTAKDCWDSRGAGCLHAPGHAHLTGPTPGTTEPRDAQSEEQP